MAISLKCGSNLSYLLIETLLHKVLAKNVALGDDMAQRRSFYVAQAIGPARHLNFRAREGAFGL